MNTRRAIVACFALLLWGCQPSVLCDPDQYEMGGGCYMKPPKHKDAGADQDAGASDAGDAADGGDAAAPADECPGDAYDGFGVKCSASSECSCHAPDCAMNPLAYCTKLNCDSKDSASCPPGWTCLVIPPGASPDPSIKTLCLKP
jgi:hypothetical protein